MTEMLKLFPDFFVWLVQTEVFWHASVLESVWAGVSLFGLVLDTWAAVRAFDVLRDLYAVQQTEPRLLDPAHWTVARGSLRNRFTHLLIMSLFLIMGLAAMSNPTNSTATGLRASLMLALTLLLSNIFFVGNTVLDLRDSFSLFGASKLRVRNKGSASTMKALAQRHTAENKSNHADACRENSAAADR